MNGVHPLSKFDPRRLAHYEMENWVAYYQKRWPRLLWVSVGMVREAFRLGPLPAVLGAYLVGRAEIAAAPSPDNDIPQAERYMRRFYRLVQRAHRMEFDLDEVARREVNWWVVHRRLFGRVENDELVEALADLYTALYGIDPAAARAAGACRAEAMLYSDRWVQTGKLNGSPLLAQEEDALCRGYDILRQALERIH